MPQDHNCSDHVPSQLDQKQKAKLQGLKNPGLSQKKGVQKHSNFGRSKEWIIH